VAGFGGRKAFVTGGSSGIGLAAARQLAAQGAHVVIAARNVQRLEEAVEEVRKARSDASTAVGFVSMDVTDETAVAKGIADAAELMGGIDLLINNSGFAMTGAVEDQSRAPFERMIDTNYMGHVNVTRAALPHLIAAKGDIGMVTSMLGFMSFYGYAAYAASKFAIVGFTEALRQEMIPHGVGVYLFYPPTTDTPGLAKENEDKPAATWAVEGMSKAFTPDQVASSLLSGIKKGRFVNMVGIDSWAIYYLNRWVPWLVRMVIDGQLKKHLAKAN